MFFLLRFCGQRECHKNGLRASGGGFPSVLGTTALRDGRVVIPFPAILQGSRALLASHWHGCNPHGLHRGRGPACTRGIIARPRRFGFLVFWWFFSGLLRAPPCAASWKRRGSRTPRDLRRLHGDPDRAAPSVGAGPGRCRSRSGLRSPSPLVLQPVSPVYCM